MSDEGIGDERSEEPMTEERMTEKLATEERRSKSLIATNELAFQPDQID